MVDLCERADLRDANLQNADLQNANLQNANLWDADLRDANLQNAKLIILTLPQWVAYIHRDTIRIGCQHHPAADWFAFDDSKIAAMNSGALEWWKIHKTLIQAAHNAVLAQGK